VECFLQSSHIRTVIKTPGIQWTSEHGLHQQRWAHFSVDGKHHLLSVLSRLSPSPDWCVGVTALDLCLDNCTWLADTAVKLYAWDAGVSNSDARELEYQRTGSKQPIRRLPDHADDDLGSLFDIGRAAEPVALLRLHRFDEKPDSDAAKCSQTRTEDQDITKVDDPVTQQSSCVMGSWSQWGACSATCGSGTRSRSRTAVIMSDSCSDVVETTSEACEIADCMRQCELYEWSEWSACSDGFVLCSTNDTNVGSCSRRRNRFYRHRGAEAICNQTLREEEPCQRSNTGNIAAFDTDVMSKCFSSADTGPCKGNFLQWYFDDILSGCRTFLYGGCRGNANQYATEEECMQACRQYQGLMGLVKGVEGDTRTTPSSNITPAAVLETTVAAGSNDSASDHNVASVRHCVMSPWSTWSDCSVTCGRNGARTRTRTVRQPASGGGRKCPRRKLRRRKCSVPACSEASDCQYSEWSSWSACARSCGTDSIQERIQRVLGRPSHRLRCPLKLERRLCTLPSCTEG